MTPGLPAAAYHDSSNNGIWPLFASKVFSLLTLLSLSVLVGKVNSEVTLLPIYS